MVVVVVLVYGPREGGRKTVKCIGERNCIVGVMIDVLLMCDVAVCVEGRGGSRSTAGRMTDGRSPA